MLRQQRLHRGPPGVHGEAQTGIHREVMVSSPISVQFPGAENKRKQRGGKLSRMPGAGLVFQWS
jgi:hypothetical protein